MAIFEWFFKQQADLPLLMSDIGKIKAVGFTGPRRETYVWCEFGFKVNLKGSRCKQKLFQPFLIEFPSNK